MLLLLPSLATLQLVGKGGEGGVVIRCVIEIGAIVSGGGKSRV
jgi:hypothetical protein